MDGAVAYALLVSTLTCTVLVSCHQVCFMGSEYDPRSGKPPRWFLPYKDPCKCTAIRLGGMNIPASKYLQRKPYYFQRLFLSENPKEIRSLFNCKIDCEISMPLGMVNGAILDDGIKASSAQYNHPAHDGRLNTTSWWGTDSPDGSWIQIDMLKSTVVTGVISQGGVNWRVMQYKVSFKDVWSSDLQHVTDAKGDIKVFDGNVNDAATPVTNMFHHSIVATVVHIEPVAWIGGVAMRLELLGCHLN